MTNRSKKPMAKALIVVDVQNDFISGSLAVEETEHLPEEIVALATQPLAYDYVVATQDWHIDPGSHFSDTPDYIDTWPVHCVADTWGAEIHDDLKDFEFNAVFRKGRYSAAYSGFEGVNDDLLLGWWLYDHDVIEVDIVGIATDYCVKATALDAVRLGLTTTVLMGYTQAVSWAGLINAKEELTAAGVRLDWKSHAQSARGSVAPNSDTNL